MNLNEGAPGKAPRTGLNLVVTLALAAILAACSAGTATHPERAEPTDSDSTETSAETITEDLGSYESTADLLQFLDPELDLQCGEPSQTLTPEAAEGQRRNERGLTAEMLRVSDESFDLMMRTHESGGCLASDGFVVSATRYDASDLDLAQFTTNVRDHQMADACIRGGVADPLGNAGNEYLDVVAWHHATEMWTLEMSSGLRESSTTMPLSDDERSDVLRDAAEILGGEVVRVRCEALPGYVGPPLHLTKVNAKWFVPCSRGVYDGDVYDESAHGEACGIWRATAAAMEPQGYCLEVDRSGRSQVLRACSDGNRVNHITCPTAGVDSLIASEMSCDEAATFVTENGDEATTEAESTFGESRCVRVDDIPLDDESIRIFCGLGDGNKWLAWNA